MSPVTAQMPSMESDAFQSPADLIEELLQARRWSQRTLGVILDIGEGTITRLMKGKQPLSAEFAVMLEDVFGVPAARFLALQSKRDLAMARAQARPDPARALRRSLHGDLPIAEMIKRGWLSAKDVREAGKVEAALLRFFGVEQAEDLAILLRAAGPAPAQAAWLRRVRQIAGGMTVAPYSQQAVRAAIGKLRGLLETHETVAAVPHVLAGCGIRFVVVEALTAAPLDGACLWLDARAPVIALSLKTDRIDRFWLMLRQALEHVLQEHGDVLLDMNADAHDFGLPVEALDALIARHVPFIPDGALVAAAERYRLHPGILAGQVQDRTGQYGGRYNRFRAHLVTVRTIVCANAVTDGWGVVATSESRSRGLPRAVLGHETVLLA